MVNQYYVFGAWRTLEEELLTIISVPAAKGFVFECLIVDCVTSLMIKFS